MSEFLQRIAKLSPKRLALLALDLQTRLEALERGGTEPIAIVGIGCRFPGGVTGPDSYWQMLREGRDAISEVPRERWDVDALYDPDPDLPGKMSTRWGGFIDGIDRFDPQFFGISPREAASMDPQQRLLLEVSWEALEHAGQAPDQLAESQTGVFMGVCGNDYFQILLRGEGGASNTYLATGTSHSVASGRLSYILGLRGPSLSIDTACSSSLVAVHVAGQSLLAGECRMAIAGGVNVILEPEPTIALSKAHMMAPDGRCKAFDAAADGFVRAEGCGIVVLKKLSDAVADRDRVIAVIAGGAVNQDGRSNGLTAPNGKAQEAVLRAALARVGCAPREVSYVEAHGTGTSLGDPIEVRALAAALGERPVGEPLLIGSVKTNIGHLEAAAGMAGLIKTALALEREEIPRQLHLRQLNPHVAWDRLPIEVVTSARPWPRGAIRRLAGVSSFGFSGTNAHLILGEAPVAAPRIAETERPLHIGVVSARSPEALRENAARLEQHVAHLEPVTDTCFTLNAGRAQLPHRAAIVASTSAELYAELRALASGAPGARTVSGHVQSVEPPPVAFLFTGQGSQYPGMGRQLYDTQPAFRRAIDDCGELLGPVLPERLHSVLWGDAVARLDETQYTQPALFALEYALSELWKSWGVVPALALGHSLGEYVAACVASVFSLEDAIKLVAARGRLMQALPAGGAMAAIGLGERAVLDLVASSRADVSLAAINGPDQTVVSGVAHWVEQVSTAAARAGARVQRLAVSHAFHSALIDPMLDEFEAMASEVRYSPPRIGVVSNVTGTLAGPHTLTSAAYWRQHARNAVRFIDGMRTLHDQGCRVFLELGPAPVLLGMARACLDGDHLRWIPSLRKGRGEWDEILQATSALYLEGVSIDWAGFDREYPRQRVALPTYPFQRDSYWIDKASRASLDAGVNQGAGARVTRTDSARGETIFEQPLGVQSLPYLTDHRLHGRMLVPAPVYIGMAARAASDLGPVSSIAIRDVMVSEPLVLDEGVDATTQLIVSAPQHRQSSFEIFSQGTNGTWTRHASGVIDSSPSESPQTEDLARRRTGLGDALPGTAFYARLERHGVAFGPTFRVIDELWRQDGRAVGRMHAPIESGGTRVHPAVVDGCFQLLGAALPGGGEHGDEGTTYLMVGVESVRFVRPATGELWAHASLRPGAGANAELLHGDIALHDSAGAPVALVNGLRLKRARREALLRASRPSRTGWLHTLEWRERALEPPATSAASSLVPAAEIAATLRPLPLELAATHALDEYATLVAELEELSLEYIVQAFSRLGWREPAGAQGTSERWINALNISPAHHRLFGRLLAILAEARLLRAANGSWVVERALPSAAPAARLERLRAQFPRFAGELSLLSRCAERLDDVLTGRENPVGLLFPNGSFAAVEELTQKSPAAQAFNTIVGRAIAAAIARVPPGQRIRVVEIGAGTGGTTASLLPLFPPERTEYVFTDVSPLFLTRARDKFAAFPYLRTELLDVEKDPLEQGFGRNEYDIVVAANVLHATRDLRVALEHARALLAPGGMLVVLEGVSPQRWVDLTFGLTDGWWRFRDTALRSTHPLLAESAWTQLARTVGCDDVVALPDRTGLGAFPGQMVLVARAPIAQASARSWVVVGGNTAARIADLMRVRGDQVVTSAGTSLDNAQAASTLLASFDGRLDGVIYVADGRASLDEAPTLESISGDAAHQCRDVLHLAQALAASTAAARARLWIVTTCAQSVRASDAIVPSGAPLWGLGRTIGMEHSEIWGGLIDVDELGGSTEAILHEITAGARHEEVALRDERRFVSRLVHTSPTGGVAPSIVPDATYLVTGGSGGMGIRVAEWLVSRGAAHLVLVSRNGVSGEAESIVTALVDRGIDVRVRQADVADSTGMAGIIEEIRLTMPQLRGVIHAAGIFDDRVLLRHDADRFARVLAPKVAGSWILHTLTRALPLDFFVMFSSAASIVAPVGLGNYAAANAFLDALAWHRRAQRLPAVSINWAAWEKTGMAAAVGDKRETQWTQGGFATMTPAEGLEILHGLLRVDIPQVAVLPVNWRTYLDWIGETRTPALLEEVEGEIAQAATPSPTSSAATASVAEQLLRLAPTARLDALTDIVTTEVRNVLGFRATHTIDPTQGLFDLGMDSLTAVELKNRLQNRVGRTVAATVVFDYPSIEALTKYLSEGVLKTGSAAPQAPITKEPAHPRSPSELDELSEDDLAAMLAQKLGQLQ